METNIQKPTTLATYGKWIVVAVFILSAINIIAIVVLPPFAQEDFMDVLNKLLSISNLLSIAGMVGFGMIAYSSSNEYIRISAAVFAISDLANVIAFYCFSSSYAVNILINIIPLIGLAVICCSGRVRAEFSVILRVAVFLALTVCIVGLWNKPLMLKEISNNYAVYRIFDLANTSIVLINFATSISYFVVMAILWAKIVRLSGYVENEEEAFGDVLSAVMKSRFVIGFPLFVIFSQIVYFMIWSSL